MTKSETLEAQVREALIRQTAEEKATFIEEHPEYKSRILKLEEEAMYSGICCVLDLWIYEEMSSMINYVFDDLSACARDVDKRAIRAIEEARQESLKQLVQVVDKLRGSVINQESLKQLTQQDTEAHSLELPRQMMYRLIETLYKPAREVESELKEHLTFLRENLGIGEDVLAEYERDFEERVELARINDEFIRKLTKIAEREGVDKAVQKETRYKVIREMFPTPEEYRAFAERVDRYFWKLFHQLPTVLMSDGGKGQIIAAMVKELEKKVKEILPEIEREYREKMIQEIYR